MLSVSNLNNCKPIDCVLHQTEIGLNKLKASTACILFVSVFIIYLIEQSDLVGR